MSKFQSIIEVLLVNAKGGVSKKAPFAPWAISEAHCVLRNDDGTAGAVGILVVPKALVDVVKPGLFTASFGMEAASYGENQGRIVAVLTNLVPVPAGAIRKQAVAA
jgi:hypothetical protein